MDKPKVKYRYAFTEKESPDLFPDGWAPQPLVIWAVLETRFLLWEHFFGNAPNSLIRIGSMYCLLLLAAIGSFGQSLPTAPAPSRMHPFFDRQNVAAISVSASSLALDGYTTEHFDSPRVRELNPVLNHFKGNDTATAIYFAANAGAEIGAMYLLHRTGHHRLERILPWVVTGVETYWCANNFKVGKGRR